MAFGQLLSIDRSKDQALYRQIAEQICIQISDGRLPTGTQLPTIRRLADLLGVTRVTAQNAYSELQSGGWIESVVGRGTFVTAAAQNRELLQAIRSEVTTGSIISNMQRLGKIAGMRSFAYAEPDPALFPDDFWSAITAQADFFVESMQYGSAQGNDLLRIELAAMLAENGITALPDDIFITSGVSQGLTIVTQGLATPGGYIAVEQPTYLGMLNVLRNYDVQPLGIPLDGEGLRLDVLEQILQTHKLCFLYLATRYQNPTGLCLSEQRRRDLYALAQRYSLTIVEDDIYGLLGLDKDDVPHSTLKAMDQDQQVIYLSGFSKVLMPGLRIGYLVAPSALHSRLIGVRQALDLTGAQFLQRALATFMHRGRFKSHLRRVVPYYRDRRDALLRALRAEMPDGVTWTEPRGGFCCWLTAPRHLYPDGLYYEALENGVAFTPGDLFLLNSDENLHMRLCFANLSPEGIHEGITTLARLMRGEAHARRLSHAHGPHPLV